MNLIFIVNDFNFGTLSIKAEEIYKILIDHNCWLFNLNTLNLGTVRPETRVLVYLAGPNRKYFCAYFEIADCLKKNELKGKDEKESFLFEQFGLSVPIKNVNKFNNPLFINAFIKKLEFISNKKYWGLFFRQSIKVVNDNDFNLLVQTSNQ